MTSYRSADRATWCVRFLFFRTGRCAGGNRL